jgi:hypothetical protein
MGNQYIMVKISSALGKVQWLIGITAFKMGAMVFSDNG